MKKLLLILFLATNIGVAQKNIALVITGYDTKMDDWEKATPTFADTSYWVIDEDVFWKSKPQSIEGCHAINPWDKTKYEVCEAYFYTDFFGTSSWLNASDIIMVLIRQKLISLGKL